MADEKNIRSSADRDADAALEEILREVEASPRRTAKRRESDDLDFVQTGTPRSHAATPKTPVRGNPEPEQKSRMPERDKPRREQSAREDREQGADMVYTEFVSADALIRNIERSIQKMAIAPGERPAAIQIYGRDVDAMVEAARIAATAKPEFIDINWGCPVKKIAGKGSGAGMLRNIPLMLEITRAVVNAVDLPVTVKTRLGWDHNSKIIVDLAEQLQDCGIAALTIHGRTRSQIYSGEADWTLIGEVKNNPRMTIPIIGNGDVTTPQRLKECYDRYGVDGVMVGRASIGAPWIFREMKQYLLTGEVPEISNEEKMALIRRQIDESIDRIDEYRGILHIRRHLAATPLFKGIRNFRPTRIAMLQANTRDELVAILDHIEKDILPTVDESITEQTNDYNEERID